MPFVWIMSADTRCMMQHSPVPAILCDTANEKGLKRGLQVEASVTDDMHLEVGDVAAIANYAASIASSAESMEVQE